MVRGRLVAPQRGRATPGRRPGRSLLVAALLAAPASIPAPASAGDEGRGEAARTGCVTELAEPDARGITRVTADCYWAVPYPRVEAIVRNQGEIDTVLSSLDESTVLPDGRVLQVHSPGFGIADRQVTLDMHVRELAGAGIRVDFRRSRRQERLGAGRVAISVDDGFWQARPEGPAHTHLSYAVRYDTGGGLESWLARRFLRSGVARALAEVRHAAERPALAAVSSGSP